MGEFGAAACGLLVGGHAALAVCAALYLAWWWVFFRPQDGKVSGMRYKVGVACIVGAAIVGIGGVALVVVGLGRVPAGDGAVPGWAFAVGAAVVYVLLCVVSVRAFRRPVTTELLLFVAWAALELAVASGMRGAEAWPGGTALAMAAGVLAVTAVNLVCYVLYYRLHATASFVDGAVPLVLAGALSAVAAVLIAGS